MGHGARLRPALGGGGFTLLETLIAAAIMAMLMSALYASFTGLVTAGQAAEERARLAHTARFIIQRMTGDLANASLFTHNRSGVFEGVSGGDLDRPADRVAFTGFSRRMVFTGAGSDQALVEWRAVETPGGELLTLSRAERPWAVVRGAETMEEEEDGLEVTGRLVSFSVRYRRGGEWVDEYRLADARALPAAVKVEFTLRGERGALFTGGALIRVGGAA
ncbi:MAG: prepilin-type N-terminal cleavage/methylation domain-containing protein [Nitrospinae bacterium]|nr:prepilin-type N-terminal cleavage/methylation domain-containing protein [Nitrospinota bacterium]